MKCLTMQLMKRSESDEHIGKAFKLLSDFDMKSWQHQRQCKAQNIASTVKMLTATVTELLIQKAF